jgi:peroxiredoxin
VNKLYAIIQKREDLRDKVKLIGIGLKNTPADIEYFKKKYQVPYPLFSDEDKSVYNLMGKAKTPYFIGVKLHEGGNPEVFYGKVGTVSKNLNDFLERMLKLAGNE